MAVLLVRSPPLPQNPPRLIPAGRIPTRAPTRTRTRTAPPLLQAPPRIPLQLAHSKQEWLLIRPFHTPRVPPRPSSRCRTERSPPCPMMEGGSGPSPTTATATTSKRRRNTSTSTAGRTPLFASSPMSMAITMTTVTLNPTLHRRRRRASPPPPLGAVPFSQLPGAATTPVRQQGAQCRRLPLADRRGRSLGTRAPTAARLASHGIRVHLPGQGPLTLVRDRARTAGGPAGGRVVVMVMMRVGMVVMEGSRGQGYVDCGGRAVGCCVGVGRGTPILLSGHGCYVVVFVFSGFFLCGAGNVGGSALAALGSLALRWLIVDYGVFAEAGGYGWCVRGVRGEGLPGRGGHGHGGGVYHAGYVG